MVGRSYPTVIQVAKFHGIILRKDLISSEEKEKIIRLLKEKMNGSEVVRILGRNVDVWKIAKRHNIKLKNSPVTSVEKEAILKLLNNGENFIDVAKKIGRNHLTIKKIARLHGIDLKNTC